MNTLLELLIDSIDTRFEGVPSDFRALVIYNPRNWRVSGWACLSVRMPFRKSDFPKEVFLYDEQGWAVECCVFDPRMLETAPVPLLDRDWWAFELLIRINDLPAHSYLTLRAEWGCSPAAATEAPVVPIPLHNPPVFSPLWVKEALPHPGTLPKSGDASLFFQSFQQQETAP